MSCSNLGRDQRLRVGYSDDFGSYSFYTNLYRRYADGHMAIKELIAAQEKLYHAGARNFLFIDVPPIHRSPASREFAVIQSWCIRLISVKFPNAKKNQVLQFIAIGTQLWERLLKNSPKAMKTCQSLCFHRSKSLRMSSTSHKIMASKKRKYAKQAELSGWIISIPRAKCMTYLHRFWRIS